jgi:biotin carboxyl carrier protein
MTTHADISGAFQRPTLVDYLIVAEHQRLDLALHLHIGALEVGVIGVSGGGVVHAELPGASGDPAITLLARLPDTRIMPERWTPRVTNVDRPWRELIPESMQESSPGRSQRLAEVRAELQELAEELAAEEPAAEEPASSSQADARAKRMAAELLDWAAIEAYMSGGVERARTLVQRSEEVRPGQLICAANLERLRLRLLEDEIATEVAEAAQ